MKKIIAYFLTAILCLGLVSCGAKENAATSIEGTYCVTDELIGVFFGTVQLFKGGTYRYSNNEAENVVSETGKYVIGDGNSVYFTADEDVEFPSAILSNASWKYDKTADILLCEYDGTTYKWMTTEKELKVVVVAEDEESEAEVITETNTLFTGRYEFTENRYLYKLSSVRRFLLKCYTENGFSGTMSVVLDFSIDGSCSFYMVADGEGYLLGIAQYTFGDNGVVYFSIVDDPEDIIIEYTKKDWKYDRTADLFVMNYDNDKVTLMKFNENFTLYSDETDTNSDSSATQHKSGNDDDALKAAKAQGDWVEDYIATNYPGYCEDGEDCGYSWRIEKMGDNSWSGDCVYYDYSCGSGVYTFTVTYDGTKYTVTDTYREIDGYMK